MGDERGEALGDTIITMVAIFLAAILMFIFPLMSISERNDDIAQLAVQTATVEFVDNARSTGKVTEDEYDAYAQTLASIGPNTYDIELQIQVLDENPSKKTSQTANDKIGENVYYTIYTSQILEEMEKNGGVKKLKEGDIITVKVKNTNTTIAQMFKNFVYIVVGNETYQISASHSGVVTANGK